MKNNEVRTFGILDPGESQEDCGTVMRPQINYWYAYFILFFKIFVFLFIVFFPLMACKLERNTNKCMRTEIPSSSPNGEWSIYVNLFSRILARRMTHDFFIQFISNESQRQVLNHTNSACKRLLL